MEASKCNLKLTEVSTNDYTEVWLKKPETFSLFNSPTIPVVTIKPSAVFNYIAALTRAFKILALISQN